MATHFQVDSVYSIHFTSADIGMLFRKSSPGLAFTVSLCSRHREALHRGCLLVSLTSTQCGRNRSHWAVLNKDRQGEPGSDLILLALQPKERVQQRDSSTHAPFLSLPATLPPHTQASLFPDFLS